MGPLAIAALVLIGALVFALEVYIIAKLARRVMRVARRLADPGQVGTLLAPDTREALRLAGVDPDRFGPADLRERPELRARVSADLRASLQGAVGGRAPEAASAAAPAPDFRLQRPAPIDAPRGGALRHAAAAVLLLAAAALLWSWLRGGA